MWLSEESELIASKTGRIKAHLREGGSVWRGAESCDYGHTAQVAQLDGENGRTQQEGCARH